MRSKTKFRFLGVAVVIAAAALGYASYSASEVVVSDSVEALAIDQAVVLGERNRYIIERAQEIGVACSSYRIEVCVNFIERVERNSQLGDILLYAKGKDVDVIPLVEEFKIGNGYIVVDVQATDEEIIAFLRGN